MGTFREHALRPDRQTQRLSDVWRALDQALYGACAQIRFDSLPGKQGVATVRALPDVPLGDEAPCVSEPVVGALAEVSRANMALDTGARTGS